MASTTAEGIDSGPSSISTSSVSRSSKRITPFFDSMCPEGSTAQTRSSTKGYTSRKRRNLYYDSVVHGIYQWSPGSAAFAPPTGKYAVADDERVCIGDHDARVGMGYAFPSKGVPSEKNGFEWDSVNWATDYAWFLDNSPAEVYPDDEIVGEFHWRLDEVRSMTAELCRAAYPRSLNAR